MLIHAFALLTVSTLTSPQHPRPKTSRQRVTLEQNQPTRDIYSGTLTGLVPGTYRLLLVEPVLPQGTPTAQFVVTRFLSRLYGGQVSRDYGSPRFSRWGMAPAMRA